MHLLRRLEAKHGDSYTKGGNRHAMNDNRNREASYPDHQFFEVFSETILFHLGYCRFKGRRGRQCMGRVRHKRASTIVVASLIGIPTGKKNLS